MNKVIFYTQVKFCEGSPLVSSCRDVKQCLIDLVEFTTIDIETNQSCRRDLVTFGIDTTPWFVILDSEDGYVFGIGIIGLQELILQNHPGEFDTHEAYLAELKTTIEQLLVQHGAL